MCIIVLSSRVLQGLCAPRLIALLYRGPAAPK